MQCAIAACSSRATIRCSACKVVGWCSDEHQRNDWTNERHPLVCATHQINSMLGHPELQTLFSMHQEPAGDLEPDWINQRYRLQYLSQGLHGVVFIARPLRATVDTGPLVVKIAWDLDQENVRREAMIAQLLTQLYVDSALDTTTPLPIVKTYDYGFGRWSVNRLRRFLNNNGTSDGRAINSLKSDELYQQVPLFLGVAVMVSRYVHGASLSKMIHEGALTTDQTYEQDVVTALLQVLLTLDQLNHAVRFSHYDLLAENVLIAQLSSEAVAHFTVASNRTYNVRSRLFAKLNDFGNSRLVYNGPGGPGVLAKKSDLAYEPWADVFTLAMSVLWWMPYERLEQMRGNKRPLLSLLFDILSAPAEALAVTQQTLYRIMNTEAEFLTREEHANFLSQLAPMIRSGFDWGSDEHELPSARNVLQRNDRIFQKALRYQPLDTDAVFDFTLQIGVSSTATRAAWRAVAPLVRPAPVTVVDLTGDSDKEEAAGGRPKRVAFVDLTRDSDGEGSKSPTHMK